MRPQDWGVFALVDDPSSPRGKGVQILSPRDVVDVRDKEDLKAHLESARRTPFFALNLPDSQFARRWHVERFRPALRYYCSALKVETPEWLAKDDDVLDMSDEEKLALFGTTNLGVREFQLVKKRQGQVSDGEAAEPAR